MRNETLAAQAAPKTTAECKAAIDSLLLEMRRLNEKIQQDDADIERLKVETRQIAAQSDVRLAQLEAQLNAPRTAA